MKISITIISVLFIFLSRPLFSEGNPYTDESEALLAQLEGNIKRTLQIVAQNEQSAGKDMSEFYFSLDFPPQQVTSIGLVLDVDGAAKGYKVLSVTPGSTADKLAIKSGDQVLAINDIEINEENHQKAIQQLNQMVAGQDLKLSYRSGGNLKDISIKITGQYMPSIKLEIGSQSSGNSTIESTEKLTEDNSQACGKVTYFFQPPINQDLYPVSINKIDDDHRKRNWHSYRLPIGKHTIYLLEYINDPGFPVRRVGRQRAKPIEIDIKANTTYYLGAKFNRRYRLSASKGKHWDPVVWKTVERECKL